MDFTNTKCIARREFCICLDKLFINQKEAFPFQGKPLFGINSFYWYAGFWVRFGFNPIACCGIGKISRPSGSVVM